MVEEMLVPTTVTVTGLVAVAMVVALSDEVARGTPVTVPEMTAPLVLPPRAEGDAGEKDESPQPTASIANATQARACATSRRSVIRTSWKGAAQPGTANAIPRSAPRELARIHRKRGLLRPDSAVVPTEGG
jgi:hypothetical protein